MTVNANEGPRAVGQIEVVTCKNCSGRVRCEDGKPVEKCCENFERS